MKRHKLCTEQQIKQSIHLTAQLQKSLKKLLSSKKKNRKSSLHRTENYREQSDLRLLEQEVCILKNEKADLLRNNEFLNRELLKYKEEVRQIKKQRDSYKNYIAFLQDNNSELKKQMVFWMKKPNVKEGSPSKTAQYDHLHLELLKLKKQNEMKEKQLLSYRKSMDKDHRSSIQKDRQTFRLRPLTQKTKVKKNHTSNHVIDNTCTSCGYIRRHISREEKKSFKKSSNKNQRQPSKNLCECHRNYIETSQFLC